MCSKNRGQKSYKDYIAVFVCVGSRSRQQFLILLFIYLMPTTLETQLSITSTASPLSLFKLPSLASSFSCTIAPTMGIATATTD